MFKFRLGSFGALRIFISRKPVVVEQNGQIFQPQESLVPAEYLSLLSVKSQFGVIRCFSSFDDLESTFDLNIQGSLYC